MWLPANQLIDAVFLALVTVFGGVVVLACAAVGQRVKSDQKTRKRERCRIRVDSIVQGLIGHTQDYALGLNVLRQELKKGGTGTVASILVAENGWKDGLEIRQKLAGDLGLVQAWQQVHPPAIRLSGRRQFSWRNLVSRLNSFSFLARAKKIDNLGRIRHQPSWPVLAEALEDPSSDVREVAIRSLAALGESASFPCLVKQLRVAAAFPESAAPERVLKAAFTRFPLRLAGQLVPLLQDSHVRLRVLTSHALREMAASAHARLTGASALANEAGQELTELVLTRLPEDESPEVRAAAADLAGWLEEDAKGRGKLLRLINDQEWFVRLHAVRALGRQKCAENAVTHMLPCMTDRNWRVREAAVHAVGSGPDGPRQLVSAFLETEDRYAREQIVEELRVSGLLGEAESPSLTGYEAKSLTADAIADMGGTPSAQTMTANRMANNGISGGP
jgi:HEAT repeat protein